MSLYTEAGGLFLKACMLEMQDAITKRKIATAATYGEADSARVGVDLRLQLCDLG